MVVCCVFFFFCYLLSVERPVRGGLSAVTGWECVRDWPKPIIHLGLSATDFGSSCIQRFASLEGLLTEADIWPMTDQRSKSLRWWGEFSAAVLSAPVGGAIGQVGLFASFFFLLFLISNFFQILSYFNLRLYVVLYMFLYFFNCLKFLISDGNLENHQSSPCPVINISWKFHLYLFRACRVILLTAKRRQNITSFAEVITKKPKKLKCISKTIFLQEYLETSASPEDLIVTCHHF